MSEIDNPMMHSDLQHAISLHGPRVHHNGVVFQVCAPHCDQVELEITERSASGETTQRHQMHRVEAVLPHYFCSDRLELPNRSDGIDYWFIMPDGQRVPDPASRFQRNGVHGASNFRYLRPPAASTLNQATEDLIIYELHIGTFTREGTYSSATKKLSRLAKLGVTAIELLPIAQCAGKWNWGYDGVNLFAPSNAYGSPEELQDFIDAAHSHGLAVILDVVYNHFGPEGNYLHPLGGLVSPHHQTAWGDAPAFDVNPDNPELCGRIARSFALANIRYWLEDYGFDGLRLDALHCIADNSQRHIVKDIGLYVEQLRTQLPQKIHLIAESNVFDAELQQPASSLTGLGFDSQWCDDFLHSVYAQLSPGEQRSSRDYQPDDLSTTLTRGYLYHGTVTQERQRHPLDDPHAPPVDCSRLIYCIQNHDFVGNHPLGRRLHHIIGPTASRAAAALLLLSPSIPMLFMGEEDEADAPFLFFTDFGDQWIRDGILEGRKREYPQFNWEDAPSPVEEQAFLQSKLDDQVPDGNSSWNWYRDLIRVRNSWRRSELLHSRNLMFYFAETSQSVLLEYSHQTSKTFVAIQLADASNATDISQTLEIQGKIILSQNANTSSTGGPSTTCELKRHGVIIGTGKIHNFLPT